MADPIRIHAVEQGGPPPSAVRAGAAAYRPALLAVYDLAVLHLSCRVVWRCPREELLRHYDEHVSADHLDVGVGTGYFLDRCHFPSPRPRVVLADLSPHSLAATARRIRRFRPTAYRLDVLAPFRLAEAPFHSIGLNFLLHCLPGSLAEKGVAFDHLRPLLARGGVLFGSTVLGGGVERPALARGAAAIFNRMGVFSNRRDTPGELESSLRRRFPEVRIRTIGCVALFAARLRP